MTNWSVQQSNFLDWCQNGTGSCVLEATAGAGKSTTLVEAARLIKGSCALLAYNKKAAEDLKNKLINAKIDEKKARSGTVHSFGFSIFRKANNNSKIDGNKINNIAYDMLQGNYILMPFLNTIVKIVTNAKQRAIGLVTDINETSQYLDIVEHFSLLDEDIEPSILNQIVEISKAVFIKSNQMMDIIDFDDMIYLPMLHHIEPWRYDVVMLDEAQDTNPLRRIFVKYILREGGRAICVGDRNQAIYAFCGADNDSLDLLIKEFNAITLPLSVSYRCPKAVVNFAKNWASNIESAPSAKEGSVSSITLDDFQKINDFNSDTAILCRNTKPLIEMAFSLIRRKIACKVEGRDIGNGLKKLATKWKKVKTLAALENQLEKYLDQQRIRLLDKKKETAFQVIEDQVETLKVIIDECRKDKKDSIYEVEKFIDNIFADGIDNVMILSTGHKAKGREFNKVFWLDRAGTCPSKYAKKEHEIKQENNICFVISTRAKNQLIEIVV